MRRIAIPTRSAGQSRALEAIHENATTGTLVAPASSAAERADNTRAIAREGLRFSFTVWLIVRISLSLWGALVVMSANPQTYENARKAYPEVVIADHTLYGYTVGLWNVYDVRHYITIAEVGYGADPGWLPAYFPGYPLLIKLASPFMGGNSLLAALVVANVCALLFFWYLYRLVRTWYGRGAARRTVIFSAVFPASFFLFMGYSEAPLLAFSVAALYYGQARKWWLAGILAGAAALVKQPGIFLLLPLAYMYWRENWNKKSLLAFLKTPDWAWLLLAPAAALAYTLYRYLYIKAPISSAADLGGSQNISFPGVPLLHALGALGPTNPYLFYNIMDIAFTILMVALTAGVLLKLTSVPLRLFSVVVLLANLAVSMYTYTSRPEINMPRRTLVIFPMFIFLSLVTPDRRLFRYISLAFFILFLYMSALFVQWVFVS